MFYIAIKRKNTVNIFQSHPMGPIGEFRTPNLMLDTIVLRRAYESIMTG